MLIQTNGPGNAGYQVVCLVLLCFFWQNKLLQRPQPLAATLRLLSSMLKVW